MPDGQEVEIVIRPQHLKIGAGPDPTPQDGCAARGVVEWARFMGSESLVEFRMDHDGSVLEGDGAERVPAEPARRCG
ncbi:MAG: TOBE domain-containing protein [Paracoccaceae bacterium]